MIKKYSPFSTVEIHPRDVYLTTDVTDRLRLERPFSSHSTKTFARGPTSDYVKKVLDQLLLGRNTFGPPSDEGSCALEGKLNDIYQQ